MIFVSSSKTILKLGAFAGRLPVGQGPGRPSASAAGAGRPSKKLVLVLDGVDFILKMMMVIRNGMKALGSTAVEVPVSTYISIRRYLTVTPQLTHTTLLHSDGLEQRSSVYQRTSSSSFTPNECSKTSLALVSQCSKYSKK